MLLFINFYVRIFDYRSNYIFKPLSDAVIINSSIPIFNRLTTITLQCYKSILRFVINRKHVINVARGRKSYCKKVNNTRVIFLLTCPHYRRRVLEQWAALRNFRNLCGAKRQVADGQPERDLKD